MFDLHVGAIFGPQGLNLNKLSRVSLDDATNIISRRQTKWFSDKKFSFMFSLYKPM